MKHHKLLLESQYNPRTLSEEIFHGDVLTICIYHFILKHSFIAVPSYLSGASILSEWSVTVLRLILVIVTLEDYGPF